MISNKIAARAFGIAFLIGYLSYGFGFGILNNSTLNVNSLATVFSSKNNVIFEAAILMAVFAPVNILLGAIMTPIFKKRNQTLAYSYLGAAIASSVMLMVGAIFLILILPLSDAYVTSEPSEMRQIELLFNMCKTANFYAYQVAMVIWGIGGLIFSYMLLVTQIVPRWMSVWGIIGYIIFVSGAFFALFGIPIDVLLDIPGGLFEIFLSIWLIAKGFRPGTINVKA